MMKRKVRPTGLAPSPIRIAPSGLIEMKRRKVRPTGFEPVTVRLEGGKYEGQILIP